MRKVLLTILAIVLILGALGAAGFAGYRFGYAQAAQVTVNGNTQPGVPNPGFRFGPHMPMHNFGFGYGFGPHGFHMMGRGMMGFGMFGLLGLLLRVAFWVLVIWALYMLITRSGWRLTRETTTSTPVPPAPTTTTTEEIKEE